MRIQGNKKMEEAGAILLAKKETIAVAESVTSGLLQLCFSSVPDAVKFYQGGITTYNIGQKYKHLQVEPVHALEVNGVSPRVATQMALQVCELFSSDWGLAITGYSSPVPESSGKLFAFYAIAYKQKIKVYDNIIPPHKDPLRVQHYYTSFIISKLLSLLKEIK